MKSPSEPDIPLRTLADAIKGQLIGSGDVRIRGVSNLELATPHDLVFVGHERLLKSAQASQAGAFLVARSCEDLNRPQIVCDHPQLAFVSLIKQFFQRPPGLSGIDSRVSQGRDVHIGPDAALGAFVSLGDRVRIGARVILHPGVVIGHDVTIGDDSLLYPNVTVLDGCRLGQRVIIHSGTVIGSDGFGYIQHKGQHHKIPQLGSVIIEDDVELGANVTVDRATFGNTIIKRGTKVDNQVQIAHNVSIGEDCILVAQVGIAGSTSIGRHVMIGGQAGLVDHLTIGDGVMIGAGSGVSHSVEPGHIVSGSPAIEHRTWLKAQTLVKKLPELRQHVHELHARITELEARLCPPKDG